MLLNAATGSEKKKIQKTVAEEKAQQPQTQLPDGKTHEDLRAIVRMTREQPTPTSPQELQAYFQTSMSEAELLLSRGILETIACFFGSEHFTGPVYFFDAAVTFYQCLRLYPSQMELLMIYQKMLPEPVMAVRRIIQLCNTPNDTLRRLLVR